MPQPKTKRPLLFIKKNRTVSPKKYIYILGGWRTCVPRETHSRRAACSRTRVVPERRFRSLHVGRGGETVYINDATRVQMTLKWRTHVCFWKTPLFFFWKTHLDLAGENVNIFSLPLTDEFALGRAAFEFGELQVRHVRGRHLCLRHYFATRAA